MATRYPVLHPTTSLLDLAGGWEETPRPSSSSSVSTSSTGRSVTPTQHLQSPRTSWTPQSTPTVRSPQPSHSSNPWHAYTIAKRSPGGSPESRTPQYTSRSTTPVQAPQPLRPNNVIAGFNHANYGASSPEQIQRIFEYPTSPTPSQTRQNPYYLDLQHLERTVITKSVAQQYLHYYPSLLVKVGVSQESKNNAYNWACRNPLVALLFLMSEDVAAFPRASFYMLTDDQLPFQEEDLERIAARPKKILDTQWRMMIRNLPRNGQHTDFRKNERAPVVSQSIVKDSESPVQVVDRVTWLGEDGTVYVRKSFRGLRATQQGNLVKQILSFNRFEHPNLAKILCSYTERSMVAFVTTPAQCNLDDYLRPIQRAADSTRLRQILSWINDLTQAVAFIHSPPRKIAHRSIRPQKILIDGGRIVLSIFGVGDELGETPAKAHAADPSYVYAAPEVVVHTEEKKMNRVADAFSLGCVFLCMLAVARGYPMDNFETWRRKHGSGLSFHANMDLIKNNFFLMLRGNKEVTQAERQALQFVEDLMVEDPKKRWRVKDIAPRVRDWNETRHVSKRRSLDGLDMEAQSITSRFSSMQVGTSPWYDRNHTVRRAYTTTTNT